MDEGETPEVKLCSGTPDRMIVTVPTEEGEDQEYMQRLSSLALLKAKEYMPKVTGKSMGKMETISGAGYFGVYWTDPVIWYQEHGTDPFTMNNLQGKTIPMWIDDPDGTERSANPRAQMRTTLDGRVQILIFRKVGSKPTSPRFEARRGKDGILRNVQTRKGNYPGAPGRIGRRGAGGAIGGGNTGVKWRHPGIEPRGFINRALTQQAQEEGLWVDQIYLCDIAWLSQIRLEGF